MVQAIGVSQRSIEGRKLSRLMRERRGEHSFGNRSSAVSDISTKARMNGRVSDSRLLFDDSYLGRINRPKLLVTVDVDDMVLLGDLHDTSVDYVKMAQSSGLHVMLLHELSNMEIKALIDSGLYDDMNYERVFNKAMTSLPMTLEADANIAMLLDNSNDGAKLAFGVVSVDGVVQDSSESTIGRTLRDGLSVVSDYYKDERLYNEATKARQAQELDRDVEVFMSDESALSNKIVHTLDLVFDDVPEKPKDVEVVVPVSKAMPVDMVGETSEDKSIRALHEKLQKALANNKQHKSGNKAHPTVDTSDELSF